MTMLRLLLVIQTIALASCSIITLDDVNGFDRSVADRLLLDDSEPTSRTLGLFEKQIVGVGKRCNDNRLQCDESQDLYCHEGVGLGFGRRCVPDGTTCLLELAASVKESYGFLSWRQQVLDNAGVTVEELELAGQSAANFEEFQKSDAYRSFDRAFQATPPEDLLTSVQKAANECVASSSQKDAEAPSSFGVITYLGLHLEIGVCFDVAFSWFWAQGDLTGPTSFSRVSFGGELGAGVELSGLFGFAFTGTPKDLIGTACVWDADVTLGPPVYGGTAWVANSNGLSSLELTFGAGVGAGIGLSFAITSATEFITDAPTFTAMPVNPTPLPSAKPTRRPTREPTPSPTPGGLVGNCKIAVRVNVGDSITEDTTLRPRYDVDGCNAALAQIDAAGYWYRYIGEGFPVTVSTCSVNTGFDTQISVWTGTCAALTCLDGVDDDQNCGVANVLSSVTFTADLDVRYFIFVYGAKGQTGTFQLDITAA